MPFIKKELTLSHTEVGLLISVLNGGAATAGIPGGMAADRLGERVVIAYSTIASGFIIIGIHWMTSLTTLLPFLFLTGFITTVSVPGGGKAVVGWFREKERGTAMGLRQTAVPLAGAVSAMVLPPLALVVGWRLALVLAGIFAVTMGFITLRVYQEPPTSGFAGEASRSGGIKTLLARKEIYGVLIYCVLLSSGQWFYLTYLMLYLTEDLQLSLIYAANLLALGQVCGAGGRIFWGFLSDRLFGGRRRPVLHLVGFLAILMCLSGSLLSAQTPLWLITFTVALLGLTLQGWNGLTHTLASEMAGGRSAGVAVGLANTSGFLGVITLTPVFGFLVDQSQSYRLAWLGLSALIAVALAALLLAREDKGN